MIELHEHLGTTLHVQASAIATVVDTPDMPHKSVASIDGRARGLMETAAEVLAKIEAAAPPPVDAPTYAEVEADMLSALRAAVKRYDFGGVAALSEALARLTSTAHLGRCR